LGGLSQSRDFGSETFGLGCIFFYPQGGILMSANNIRIGFYSHHTSYLFLIANRLVGTTKLRIL
jgi:hypothetical protein